MSKPTTLTFSFQYYDIYSNEFCISNRAKWEEGQVQEVFRRLRELSGKTFNELFQRSTYHFHEVDWDRTTKKGGFPDATANEPEPYQFALPGTSGKGARVFAAFSGNTFHIVWIDINHEIWPTALKHT